MRNWTRPASDHPGLLDGTELYAGSPTGYDGLGQDGPEAPGAVEVGQLDRVAVVHLVCHDLSVVRERAAEGLDLVDVETCVRDRGSCRDRALDRSSETTGTRDRPTTHRGRRRAGRRWSRCVPGRCTSRRGRPWTGSRYPPAGWRSDSDSGSGPHRPHPPRRQRRSLPATRRRPTTWWNGRRIPWTPSQGRYGLQEAS